MKDIFLDEEAYDVYTSTILKYDKLFTIKNRYYELASIWLMNRFKKRFIYDYLIDKKFYKVSIYGLGNLGKFLFEELKESNKVTVISIIDKSREVGENRETCVLPEDVGMYNRSDCIIITVPYAFDEIRQDLLEYGYSREIICIDEILFQLNEDR